MEFIFRLQENSRFESREEIVRNAMAELHTIRARSSFFVQSSFPRQKDKLPSNMAIITYSDKYYNTTS